MRNIGKDKDEEVIDKPPLCRGNGPKVAHATAVLGESEHLQYLYIAHMTEDPFVLPFQLTMYLKASFGMRVVCVFGEGGWEEEGVGGGGGGGERYIIEAIIHVWVIKTMTNTVTSSHISHPSFSPAFLVPYFLLCFLPPSLPSSLSPSNQDGTIVEDMYIPKRSAQYVKKGYKIVKKTLEGVKCNN